MEQNTRYSFKDYTGASFVNADPDDFKGEIVGSCFAQENGMRDVFPPGMKGVHFRRCNLDNCIIPPGNTLQTDGWDFSTNRHHHVQNDGQDWVIDSKKKPIEPLNKKSFIQAGKSLDPKSIPVEFYREEEMTKNDYEAYFVKGAKKHPWFKESPAILSQRTELTTSELKAANLPLVTHFDATPTVLETKVKKGMELKRVEQAKDGSFIPIMEETPAEEYVKVQGPVTYYKVKGRAWLYAGQESEEAGGKV